MPSEALQVYKKEAREMLRDKRVRSSALVGPFLLVLMMMVMFGTLISKVSEPSNLKLHVVNPNNENPFLKGMTDRKVTVVPVASLEAGRKLVEEGKAAIVLQFPEDYTERLSKGEATTIQAIFDSKEQRSQVAMGAMERGVNQVNQATVKKLLTTKGYLSPWRRQFKSNLRTSPGTKARARYSPQSFPI